MLAEQIYEKSSSLYKHIRNSILLLFLLNEQVIFNVRQRNIMSIDELIRSNSVSYLAILEQLSKILSITMTK